MTGPVLSNLSPGQPGSLPLGTVITYATETTGLDGSGNYVLGQQVTFQTASGSLASIFVPYNNLVASYVGDEVTRRAVAIETIFALSNPLA